MAEETPEELSVRISKDRLRVLVDCAALGDDSQGVVKRLEEKLGALGLDKAAADLALDEWLARQAEQGLPIRDAVLLEGRPPVPPVDGGIEWAGPFLETGFSVDETTGAIDYRQHAAQRSVEAGQLLATVHPPRDGADGRDVFGKPIRVGRPQTARLRAGENVRANEEGGQIHAVKQGRIRWVSNVLAVDPVFRIPGSVGLQTGHIRHPGAVEIDKDVEAGARLEADGDIEVKQVVEAADVVCGGSLTVRGGVTGGDDRSVRVAGSVQARFLLEADLEAGGDVVVEREIVHCSVKTRGAVVMPAGRIVGGSVTARCGIQVAQAGSVASVPTVLCAGEDLQTVQQLAALNTEVAGLEEQLAKIEATLEPLLGELDSLPRDRAEAVRALLRQADGLRTRIQELRGEAEALREHSKAADGAEVAIRDVVFPETAIWIGEECFQIKEEVQGPVGALLEEGKARLERAR